MTDKTIQLPAGFTLTVSAKSGKVFVWPAGSELSKQKALVGSPVTLGPYPAAGSFVVSGDAAAKIDQWDMDPMHMAKDETINPALLSVVRRVSELEAKQPAFADTTAIEKRLDAAYYTIAQMTETQRKQDAVFKAVVAFMMNPNNCSYWPENQPDDIRKLMNEYGIVVGECL